MLIEDKRTNTTEFGQLPVGAVAMYEGQAVMKIFETDDGTNAVYLSTGNPEFIYPDVSVEKIKAKLILE